MKQKKIILPEHEIPTEWYNIQAEMPTKPLPMLDSKSLRPITAEDLYPIFVEESAEVEVAVLVQNKAKDRIICNVNQECMFRCLC